ncbi:MATE family efflux transporter [Pontibacter sp. G13]|uniref:MATE family efflux transporter n=1 Tax=Pontibacter sp. G13 TaxID=3074898 RepID=UPI002889998A|nr:MATE family efflux transporter [Pontibacter sp. G13]WNJ18073.1 MATE family efflux transporter [Pontibacter sp. G13]
MSTPRTSSLTSGPIAPTLARLTGPMILGMFSMIAFNLADFTFVGMIGTLDQAAMSFTLPVVMILGAIGMGMSMGAAAVVSKAVGEENPKKVQRLTVDSLFLAVVLAGIFVFVGLLTIDPLFRALGANEETLPKIKEYMEIWYAGVIFVIVPFVGNSAIRAAGDTLTPAIIMISMVGLNILLDYLLILGPGPFPEMGIRGAAWGTLIARGFSLIFGMIVLFRRNMLTAAIPSAKDAWASWLSILKIGLPASATNLVVPMTTALITKIVSEFGEGAIAAIGVASRIDLFAIMVVVALSSVMGPFVGQNLGARKYQRLKEGIDMAQRFSLIWGIAMMGLLFLTSKWVAPIFTNDPEVIDILIQYLWIAPIGYAPRCIYALGNTILNTLGKPLQASSITIVQMFGIYLPMAWAGAQMFGLQGVFWSLALAYVAGGTASFLLVRREVKILTSPAAAMAS